MKMPKGIPIIDVDAPTGAHYCCTSSHGLKIEIEDAKDRKPFEVFRDASIDMIESTDPDAVLEEKDSGYASFYGQILKALAVHYLSEHPDGTTMSYAQAINEIISSCPNLGEQFKFGAS